MNDWRDRALCAEVGGTLFFPEGKGSGNNPDAVRAVCRTCQVRVPCLAFALDGYEEGIWGGYTQRARIRVRRRRDTGESLEDIIAGDDSRFYARQEARETARAGRYARHLTRGQEHRRAVRAGIEASHEQPREAAA